MDNSTIIGDSSKNLVLASNGIILLEFNGRTINVLDSKGNPNIKLNNNNSNIINLGIPNSNSNNGIYYDGTNIYFKTHGGIINLSSYLLPRNSIILFRGRKNNVPPGWNYYADTDMSGVIYIINTENVPVNSLVSVVLEWSKSEVETTIKATSFNLPTLTKRLSSDVPLLIEYSSSAPGVAVVDSNGNVIIKAVGTTNITATTYQTSLHTASSCSYRLTVKKEEISAFFVEDSKTITIGETFTPLIYFKVNGQTYNGFIGDYYLVSETPNIVLINNRINITGKTAGETNISINIPENEWHGSNALSQILKVEVENNAHLIDMAYTQDFRTILELSKEKGTTFTQPTLYIKENGNVWSLDEYPYWNDLKKYLRYEFGSSSDSSYATLNTSTGTAVLNKGTDDGKITIKAVVNNNDEFLSSYSASKIDAYLHIIITDNSSLQEPDEPDPGESGDDLGTYKYSVGLLSDIHMNTDESDASSDAGDELDLTNALSAFKSQGVDFIATCGDMLETWQPWAESWGRTKLDAQDFRDTFINANSGLKLFAVLGNHDYYGLYEKRSSGENNATASALRIQEIWKAYVQPSAITGSLSLTYLEGSNNLTYYFTKNDDLYIMLSVDYGGDYPYIIDSEKKNYQNAVVAKNILNTNDSDVSAMLSYISDTGYNSTNEALYNYQYYSPKSLIWLKNLIESNTNKKIFVFSHHFLPHKVGNSNGIPSNGDYGYATIRSSYSYSTTLESLRRGSDGLSGIEFWFINKLNNNYKNVYWFSGHSHISWNYNSGNALKCAHIDNHDYNIVAPSTSNDYSANGNDDRNYCHKVYTKSSMTAKGSSGWWIGIPSLSKPRTISGSTASYLYDDAEISIMDVYTNGIKIKGYKLRENGAYNLRKVVEQDLLLNGGSSSGEVTPSDPTPSDPTPSDPTPSTDPNKITFKITNDLSTDVLLTGAVIINISQNSNASWGDSSVQQSRADMIANSSDSCVNVIKIAPGGTYYGSATIEKYYPDSPAHEAATTQGWYLLNNYNGNGGGSIYFYTGYYYGNTYLNNTYEPHTSYDSKHPNTPGSKAGNAFFVASVPSPRKLQKGAVIEVHITKTLANTPSGCYSGTNVSKPISYHPDKSGYYVISPLSTTGSY